MALLDTLTDNFNDASIDGAKWGTFTDSGTTIVETAVLTFTPASSTVNSQGVLFSNTTYDLTGSYGLCHVTSVCPTNVNNFITLKLDGSNEIQWKIDGGTLRAHKKIANVESDVLTTTYNSTTHAWLRMRESGGTFFFDYSSNGVTWTNFTSLANPFSITSLQVVIGVFEFSSQASPGTFVIDDWNIPGVATSQSFVFQTTNKFMGS